MIRIEYARLIKIYFLVMSRNKSLDDGRECHDCIVVLFPPVTLGDNFGLESNILDRAVRYAFKR